MFEELDDNLLPGLDDTEGEDSGGAEATPESDDPLEGRPDLQAALLSLYQLCSAEDRYPRLVEVKDTKQAEFYWQGRQYIWWSNQDKQWSLPAQAQSGSYSDLNIDDMPRFEFVTNIYQATGLTVIGAVAGGGAPAIRFFPEDAENEADLETAAGRTKLSRLIARWNPPKKLMQEEVYHAWTGGFICWRSRYVKNGAKYGVDSVNLLQQGEESPESTITCPECHWSAPAEQAVPPVPCPQCGRQLTEADVTEEEPIPVPEEGEPTDVERGRQIISVYGALNCKRPQHANHQSQYHYFAIEEELHYATLRAAFEDKAKQIKPGMSFGADDAFERSARLSVAENTKMLSQSGASSQSLATFATVWFRPTAFWMLDDQKKREDLVALFPRGCRAEFAGETYCTSEAESMDDAIVTTHAMPGRGQHRPAIGSSLISVQDRFNTFTNIEAETYEYGIPITYRASDTFSAEASDDQRAAPGLEIEVFLQPGQDIRQKITQVRADSVSPDMAKHTMDLMGPVTQYLTGTFPALTGAGEDQPNTLGQQGMQRDQAMGRMGVFYVNLKQAHADVMTIACRDFERHTDGEVKIPVLGASGDFESESVDVTALEGEAEAYPEGDENFPELWNQQRATMMTIMDSPYGQKLAEVPDNSELFAKLTGIPGLKIPELDSRRKQLKEIAELVRVPSGEELLTGIAPMVEVDPETDDNPVEAATCLSWMNGEVGQKTKRENPVGYQAVREHYLKHKNAIPPPAPPEKPLSETLSAAFKDMPPEAQAQVLEKWGIHVSPQDFVDGLKLEVAKKQASKPAPPASGAPHPIGTEAPPAAGA